VQAVPLTLTVLVIDADVRLGAAPVIAVIVEA